MTLLRRVVDALLPAHCLRCGGGTDGPLLCAPCTAELPWNRPACPGCALPQAVAGTLPCPACQLRPEPFDAAVSALRLETGVRGAVHALKYSARLLEAEWLGQALAAAVRARRDADGAPLRLPQALLPMPLTRRRLFDRGFNQALEIARVAGRALGVPVLATATVQLRATPDQIGQNRRERQTNVAGAYAVDADAVRHRHVALVDDVMTTGASLAELARAAKAAGAVRVEAWSAARTPLWSAGG